MCYFYFSCFRFNYASWIKWHSWILKIFLSFFLSLILPLPQSLILFNAYLHLTPVKPHCILLGSYAFFHIFSFFALKSLIEFKYFIINVWNFWARMGRNWGLRKMSRFIYTNQELCLQISHSTAKERRGGTYRNDNAR